MKTVDKIRDLEMKNHNTILTEMLQKKSAFSSGKIDKYEYPRREEILPSNRSQIIEQAIFIYSPLRKALEKQSKKQVDALKSINFSDKEDNKLNKI